MNYGMAVRRAVTAFRFSDKRAQSFVLALAHNDSDAVASQYRIDKDDARRFKAVCDLKNGGFA